MKVVSAIVGLLFVSIIIKAQSDSGVISTPQVTSILNYKPFTDGYDRIIKLNRDTLVVTIQKITQSEIVFLYPLNKVQNRLPVFHVKEILGKDGVPNTAFKGTPNTLKNLANDTIPLTDWKTITVTNNAKDVEGLTELGNIDSRSSGDRVTTDIQLLEKNAILHLKKKAAVLGATKVLITDKNAQSPYGENPIVELSGVAYK